MRHHMFVLGLVLIFAHIGSSCDDDFQSEYFYEGDYNLGGLFSLHASGADRSPRYTPVVDSCPSFNISLAGYLYFQVMKFAVQEINNSSSLLPNVTLGYNIFDTCYVHNNIQPALKFISRDDVIDTDKSYTSYIPTVSAVIGPDNSDAAETTADIFNLLRLPQINVFATSQRMSSLSLPACFQTIPSSRVQQQAFVDILSYFNWTWIAVLGSFDEYGMHGVEQFLEATLDLNICLAYKDVIPIKVSGQEAMWKSRIRQIANNIIFTNVNVILIFSLDIILVDFFNELVDMNFPSKIWLATETWSLSTDIYGLPKMNRLGVIFGIALKYVKIPGFEENLKKVYNQSRNSSGGSRFEENCNQNCDDCHNISLSNLLGFAEQRSSFSIYAAVYAVANALHDVLGCNKTYCDNKDIYPWQVTEALKRVNFSLLNNEISFNVNGDSPTGYDIVYWNWFGHTPFLKVGSYPSLGKLDINLQNIIWQTSNNAVPSSVCSSECLPGQQKQPRGYYKCCFSCISCAAGTFLYSNGTCVACKEDQWSKERSTICLDKTRIFMTWSNPITISVLSITILGILINIVIMVTFFVQLSSPVVKAAGGRMCFLMLTSLTVSYLSILAYLGEPGTVKCIFRLPIYSIALTVSFSYISIRSFQIVCIFKMASKLPATFDYWVKQNGQYICLGFLCGVQVFISIIWIIINPPTATTIELSSDQVLLECSQFGSVYNIFQFSYNVILSLLCFTFSYMGKELPKNYSEAKCITFAMLIFFVVCISFFTAQLIDVGEYITAINAGLAWLSLMGIKGGYFFPKCYIIFCHPQFNTTKYFQTTIQSYTKRGSGSTK
ncbi:taste receptor type 1 member 2-like [Lithobates pipiens]